jgi:hypothetical protein
VLKFDPKFTPFFDPVLAGYMQIRFIFRGNPNSQKAPLAVPNRTQKVRFGTPFKPLLFEQLRHTLYL